MLCAVCCVFSLVEIKGFTDLNRNINNKRDCDQRKIMIRKRLSDLLNDTDLCFVTQTNTSWSQKCIVLVTAFKKHAHLHVTEHKTFCSKHLDVNVKGNCHLNDAPHFLWTLQPPQGISEPPLLWHRLWPRARFQRGPCGCPSPAHTLHA